MPLISHHYALAAGAPYPEPLNVPSPWSAAHILLVEYERAAIAPDGEQQGVVPASTLSYQDAMGRHVAFAGDQLTWGTLDYGDARAPLARTVTVELWKTTDTGATFFTLVHAPLHPAGSGATPVTAVAIISEVPGPDAVPRPTATYRGLSLTGTYTQTTTP